jgi:hypothetical protein
VKSCDAYVIAAMAFCAAGRYFWGFIALGMAAFDVLLDSDK